MSLTLCICTMNRPVELAKALRAVRAGTQQPDTVLVSDDARSPEIRHIVESFGATYQAGPGEGLGNNRNACIAIVDTDFVAFIDDDVLVPVDFVQNLVSAAHPNAVVTGWEQTHSPFLIVRTTAHNADFLGFQKADPAGNYHSIVINATIFPQSLFAHAEFDRFTRYGYEEIDLARQARALGYPIEFDENVWVDHYPSPTNRDAYAVGLDAARLYLTHRARTHYYRTPIRAHLLLLVGWCHVVLSGLKARRPVNISLGIIAESRRLIGASSPPRWLSQYGG